MLPKNNLVWHLGILFRLFIISIFQFIYFSSWMMCYEKSWLSIRSAKYPPFKMLSLSTLLIVGFHSTPCSWEYHRALYPMKYIITVLSLDQWTTTYSHANINPSGMNRFELIYIKLSNQDWTCFHPLFAYTGSMGTWKKRLVLISL